MAEVRVYVEGGGNDDTTRRACREGFATLMAKVVPEGRRPKLIACGTRRAAFDRFVIATRAYPQAACLLLVDSEAPLRDGQAIWPFLHARDGWQRPAGVRDEHVHLMVQSMEAWLVADPAALERFYDGGFKADKLPRRDNVEEVAKADLERALEAATRGTKARSYDKGSHSFKILGLIEPRALAARSPFAARFFDALRRHCGA